MSPILSAILTAILSPAPTAAELSRCNALDLARKKLDFMRHDFDTWEATTVGADFS